MALLKSFWILLGNMLCFFFFPRVLKQILVQGCIFEKSSSVLE